MADFCMPSLGADMVKGTLVEWKVKPGDRVKRGDIIAEVETDKGIIEIEVFIDGIVEKLLVEPGDEVPVGEVMALIRPEEPQDTEPKTVAPSLDMSTQVKEKATPEYTLKKSLKKSKETSPSGPGEIKRSRISPAARKRASELGVDFTSLQGTGPNGAINLADVEKAASARKPTPEKIDVEPVSHIPEGTDFQVSMRNAIASAMSRSNRDIPHYYLETRIDLSNALRWLTEENQKRSVKDRLLSVVLFLKATALALSDIPALNGYWIENRFQAGETINIGFAIALRQGGLISPAIHHVDQKSLDELMADMRDLITRTRAGKLRSSEMTDATITLTNLGDLGVERSFGVIYPPQVALVSFGKIMEQPWAENGMIGIRRVVSATLAGDHRATDGLTGARFLNAVNAYLQETEKL